MFVGAQGRIAAQACVGCARQIDAVTKVSGKPGGGGAQPGDFTMCLYCGTMMAFTRGLGLRLLTKAELREAESIPVLKPLLLAQAQLANKRPS
jgi:hypothetical protein